MPLIARAMVVSAFSFVFLLGCRAVRVPSPGEPLAAGEPIQDRESHISLIVTPAIDLSGVAAVQGDISEGDFHAHIDPPSITPKGARLDLGAAGRVSGSTRREGGGCTLYASANGSFAASLGMSVGWEPDSPRLLLAELPGRAVNTNIQGTGGVSGWWPWCWVAALAAWIGNASGQVEDFARRTINAKLNDALTTTVQTANQTMNRQVDFSTYLRDSRRQLKFGPEETFRVCLSPTSLARGPIAIEPQKVRASLSVGLMLSSGWVQPNDNSECSNPTVKFSTSEQDVTASSQFELFVRAPARLLDIERAANAVVEHGEYSIPDGKIPFINRKVTVRQVKVGAWGADSIYVDITLAGGIEGTLRLTGQIAYDPQGWVVEAKNLDFDLETRDFLQSSAAWFLKMPIRDELRQYSRQSLGNIVQPVQDYAATLRVNGLGASLVPHVSVVEPTAIVVNSETVDTMFRIAGTLDPAVP